MHRVIPPLEHRVVSLLPLSHLFEQAVALFYALDVGADVLYVRSRNPRVIFEAIRGHRTTSMVVVPQILDLFWAAVEREVEKSGRATSFDRLRRHRPAPARTRCAGSCSGGSTPARRRAPAVRQLGRVPAAGAPAGVGGPRRRRHPGLRGDRDRVRDVHDARGSRARDGRAADAAGRAAARRRRRGPVPRPDALQGLLARPRGDRRGLHRGRLVPDRRHRPARRRRAARS